MLQSHATDPNSLWGGNPVGRVFRGRAGSGLVSFAGRCGALGMAGAAVRARFGQLVGQAGGSIGLPASIMQFQALSAARIPPVAQAPSHGARGGTVFCGFGVPRRHMASYATQASESADPASIDPALRRPAGGGVPPKRHARAPYARRAGGIGNLTKSGPKPSPRTACPEAGHEDLGCRAWRREPKISKSALGSGVWALRTTRETRLSARGAARRNEAANGIRVWVGMLRHRGSGSGKVAKLGRVRA